MFVVTMYRVGPKQEYFETHSYVLGVFSTIERAKFFANVEMLSRAGKYDAYCTENALDAIEKFVGVWLDYEYSQEVQDEVEARYGKNWVR